MKKDIRNFKNLLSSREEASSATSRAGICACNGGVEMTLEELLLEEMRGYDENMGTVSLKPL